MDVQAVKDFMSEHVEQIKPELFEISETMFQNPEIGFQEFKAYQLQVDFLRKNGFTIQEHVADMETAYIAEYDNGGDVNFAIVSEYDALPNLGQACGHNLICSASMGAAAALKAAMETYDIKGKLTVVGGPSEENVGGKIFLLNAGYFDNIDCAIAVHPTTEPSRVAGGNNAYYFYEIEYFGETAHASNRPFDGVNAFDAGLLFLQAVALMRQQTKDGVRMHGDFVDGLPAGGTICGYVKMEYDVSAPDDKILMETVKKIDGCIQAGAVGTGCTVKVKGEKGYKNRIPNQAMGEVFRVNCVALGEEMKPGMPADNGGEDFGNVSHFIPGINPHMTIFPDYKISSHTVQFRDIVHSTAGERFIVLNSKTMAHTGFDLMLSPETVQKAKDELTQRMKDLYGADWESYRK